MLLSASMSSSTCSTTLRRITVSNRPAKGAKSPGLVRSQRWISRFGLFWNRVCNRARCSSINVRSDIQASAWRQFPGQIADPRPKFQYARSCKRTNGTRHPSVESRCGRQCSENPCSRVHINIAADPVTQDDEHRLYGAPEADFLSFVVGASVIVDRHFGYPHLPLRQLDHCEEGCYGPVPCRRPYSTFPCRSGSD
jgi:hypothetical protein